MPQDKSIRNPSYVVLRAAIYRVMTACFQFQFFVKEEEIKMWLRVRPRFRFAELNVASIVSQQNRLPLSCKIVVYCRQYATSRRPHTSPTDLRIDGWDEPGAGPGPGQAASTGAHSNGQTIRAAAWRPGLIKIIGRVAI